MVAAHDKSGIRWLALGFAVACGATGGTRPGEVARAASRGAVACGAATCAAPEVICCVAGADLEACGQAAECGSDVYTCRGQTNCPDGTVCCVTVGGFGSGQDLSQCQTSCGGGDGTHEGDTAQVCQPGDRCPAGTTCQTGFGEYVEPVCAPATD